MPATTKKKSNKCCFCNPKSQAFVKFATDKFYNWELFTQFIMQGQKLNLILIQF